MPADDPATPPGDDDAQNQDPATPPTPATLTLDREAVAELAGKISEGVVGGLKPPTTDDPAAAAAAHKEKVDTALDEFNKLAEDGKYSEGLRGVMAALQQAPTAPQQDVTTQPAFIALQEGAIDRARARDADIFTKWEDEVQEQIEALPPVERVTTAGVRKAVAAVKLAHAQEIIDAATAEREEKLRADLLSGVAPQNAPSPSLGETDDTDLQGLSLDERGVAKTVGVSYAAYAEQKKAGETRRDADDMYPIISEDLPEAGAF
jgi:hypothetical protein